MSYARLTFGMVWPPDYYLDVPCGHCFSCQKSQNNQYRIRLLYEVRRYPPNSCLFITLTFDDDNLSRFADDYNKAVRLFLDRCRKRFGFQLRHWIIGEFGSLKGRLHYHGILFNVPSVFFDSFDLNHPGNNFLLASLWSYGFVFVGYVNDKTCSYITKYLTKSINGDKVRPRVITSKGIGSNYFDSLESKLHRLSFDSYQPFLFLNGYKQALPRYYYDKIFTKFDRDNMVLNRYLNPVFSWNGVIYSSESERDAARFATWQSNLSSGLSFLNPFPSRRRGVRFDSLINGDKTFVEQQFLSYGTISNSF